MRNLTRTRSLVALAIAIATVIAGLAFTPAAAQSPCGATYTVQPGDTLWSIARRCATTLTDILEANPTVTNPSLIFVNQVLTIPQPDAGPEPPEQPDQAVYIVQPGEWLMAIGRRHGVSFSALLAANPQVSTPNIILPGQRLIIPLAQAQPRVTLSPTSGRAGTTVQVTGSGFPASTEIEVAVGQDPDNAFVVATVQSTGSGLVNTTVRIPEVAEAGQMGYAVLRVPGTESRVVSNAFRVTGAAQFTRANLYLIAIGDAGQAGPEIGCDDSVVPVAVEFSPTTAPLTAVLSRLLALDTAVHQPSGRHNALAASDLAIESVTILDGTATIALTCTLQLGGVCDAPRVEAQLHQTALQFSTVDEVEVTINGTPLEDLLSSR
jgi:LysM repeat protein